MKILQNDLNQYQISNMNTQSAKKEVIYWNIHTFNHLNSIVDLFERQQPSTKPHQHDFQLRDFYFNPSFQIFGKKINKTFVESSAQLLKNFVSFNQLGYIQSVSFQRQMEKHRFWNKIYSMYIKNKQDLEAKQTIRNIVWTYRLIPISMFLFAAVTIFRLSGIYKMSLKKQVVGLIAATIMGDIFIRTKKSSQIFYLIPPLSNSELEQERLQIVNKSIVLDGKINQIQIHPSYIDQLIQEAEKESDEKEQKLILEAAGYTVVDSIDFKY